MKGKGFTNIVRWACTYLLYNPVQLRWGKDSAKGREGGGVKAQGWDGGKSKAAEHWEH